MKKGIITLAAALLLIPLTTMAQPGPDNGPFCPEGRGMGQGPGMACQHGPGPMGQGCHMKGKGGPGFGDDHMQFGRILMFADELGLSEQQRDQFRQMQTDFRMQMIDREAEVEKGEIQLRSLMMDKDAPENEVSHAIDNAARLKAEVQKLRYSHHRQMRGVLTADQLDKLQKMREEHRQQRMGQGRHKGMGMGQGQGPGPQPSAPGSGRHSMRGH